MPRQFQRNQQQQAPQQQSQPHGQQDGNHNGSQKNRPVMSFKVTVSGTTLDCAVWAHTQRGDRGDYTAYTVSINRSYPVEEQGKTVWKQGGGFRPQELPVVQYLLNKAYSWILEEKTDTPI